MDRRQEDFKSVQQSGSISFVGDEVLLAECFECCLITIAVLPQSSNAFEPGRDAIGVCFAVLLQQGGVNGVDGWGGHLRLLCIVRKHA